MTTTRSTVRRSKIVVDLLVVLLAVLAFAGVGFLVGRSNQISSDQVANARESAWGRTFSSARDSAYRTARQEFYTQGRAAGIATATAAGRRAGHAAGQAAVQQRADASHFAALAAALGSTRVHLTRSTRIERCVEVGQGLCEVLGPGATGKRCPRGSVPFPVGGATCVPRILLLAAGKG
jgi:hypothetical protein